MPLIGYARVSSAGQSLDLQEEQLRAAGVAEDHLFSEKRSGTTREGRSALEEALRFVRRGDVLLVTRLDRLARSVTDLRHIVDQIVAKGAGIRALQQGDFDTTSSNGKLLLHTLAAFAEFETDLRRERQMEGIAKAKAEGRYRGGKPSVDAAEVRRLKAEGKRPVDIARELKIARASVYRALEGPDESG